MSVSRILQKRRARLGQQQQQAAAAAAPPAGAVEAGAGAEGASAAPATTAAPVPMAAQSWGLQASLRRGSFGDNGTISTASTAGTSSGSSVLQDLHATTASGRYRDVQAQREALAFRLLAAQTGSGGASQPQQSPQAQAAQAPQQPSHASFMATSHAGIRHILASAGAPVGAAAAAPAPASAPDRGSSVAPAAPSAGGGSGGGGQWVPSALPPSASAGGGAPSSVPWPQRLQQAREAAADQDHLPPPPPPSYPRPAAHTSYRFPAAASTAASHVSLAGPLAPGAADSAVSTSSGWGLHELSATGQYGRTQQQMQQSSGTPTSASSLSVDHAGAALAAQVLAEVLQGAEGTMAAVEEAMAGTAAAVAGALSRSPSASRAAARAAMSATFQAAAADEEDSSAHAAELLQAAPFGRTARGRQLQPRSAAASSSSLRSARSKSRLRELLGDDYVDAALSATPGAAAAEAGAAAASGRARSAPRGRSLNAERLRELVGDDTLAQAMELAATATGEAAGSATLQRAGPQYHHGHRVAFATDGDAAPSYATAAASRGRSMSARPLSPRAGSALRQQQQQDALAARVLGAVEASSRAAARSVLSSVEHPHPAALLGFEASAVLASAPPAGQGGGLSTAGACLPTAAVSALITALGCSPLPGQPPSVALGPLPSGTVRVAGAAVDSAQVSAPAALGLRRPCMVQLQLTPDAGALAWAPASSGPAAAGAGAGSSEVHLSCLLEAETLPLPPGAAPSPVPAAVTSGAHADASAPGAFAVSATTAAPAPATPAPARSTSMGHDSLPAAVRASAVGAAFPHALRLLCQASLPLAPLAALLGAGADATALAPAALRALARELQTLQLLPLPSAAPALASAAPSHVVLVLLLHLGFQSGAEAGAWSAGLQAVRDAGEPVAAAASSASAGVAVRVPVRVPWGAPTPASAAAASGGRRRSASAVPSPAPSSVARRGSPAVGPDAGASAGGPGTAASAELLARGVFGGDDGADALALAAVADATAAGADMHAGLSVGPRLALSAISAAVAGLSFTHPRGALFNALLSSRSEGSAAASVAALEAGAGGDVPRHGSRQQQQLVLYAPEAPEDAAASALGPLAQSAPAAWSTASLLAASFAAGPGGPGGSASQLPPPPLAIYGPDSIVYRGRTGAGAAGATIGSGIGPGASGAASAGPRMAAGDARPAGGADARAASRDTASAGPAFGRPSSPAFALQAPRPQEPGQPPHYPFNVTGSPAGVAGAGSSGRSPASGQRGSPSLSHSQSRQAEFGRTSGGTSGEGTATAGRAMLADAMAAASQAQAIAAQALARYGSVLGASNAALLQRPDESDSPAAAARFGSSATASSAQRQGVPDQPQHLQQPPLRGAPTGKSSLSEMIQASLPSLSGLSSRLLQIGTAGGSAGAAPEQEQSQPSVAYSYAAAGQPAQPSLAGDLGPAFAAPPVLTGGHGLQGLQALQAGDAAWGSMLRTHGVGALAPAPVSTAAGSQTAPHGGGPGPAGAVARPLLQSFDAAAMLSRSAVFGAPGSAGDRSTVTSASGDLSASSGGADGGPAAPVSLTHSMLTSPSGGLTVSSAGGAAISPAWAAAAAAAAATTAPAGTGAAAGEALSSQPQPPRVIVDLGTDGFSSARPMLGGGSSAATARSASGAAGATPSSSHPQSHSQSRGAYHQHSVGPAGAGATAYSQHAMSGAPSHLVRLSGPPASVYGSSTSATSAAPGSQGLSALASSAAGRPGFTTSGGVGALSSGSGGGSAYSSAAAAASSRAAASALMARSNSAAHGVGSARAGGLSAGRTANPSGSYTNGGSFGGPAFAGGASQGFGAAGLPALTSQLSGNDGGSGSASEGPGGPTLWRSAGPRPQAAHPPAASPPPAVLRVGSLTAYLPASASGPIAISLPTVQL